MVPKCTRTGQFTLQDILFPPHLRLSPRNWRHYREAVVITCRLYGVEDHLGRSWLLLDERKDPANAAWVFDDELCKAIILLNMETSELARVWPNFAAVSSTELTAGGIWETLEMELFPDLYNNTFPGFGIWRILGLPDMDILSWGAAATAAAYALYLAVGAS